ncbi:GATA zinc finger domain-containing protein 14-like isoform X2 [Galleria mellonella]|uniref:GATA zinc finger domain-containing protein 14-like isoform X2 n=1 Tax=Galleria mellonella TaxID=7137 RepID=A0ABM3MV86_GALME|nr:GATA zinc finger domain-containing protein 14-like isoform X2 [Galleria mellonella]
MLLLCHVIQHFISVKIILIDMEIVNKNQCESDLSKTPNKIMQMYNFENNYEQAMENEFKHHNNKWKIKHLTHGKDSVSSKKMWHKIVFESDTDSYKKSEKYKNINDNVSQISSIHSDDDPDDEMYLNVKVKQEMTGIDKKTRKVKNKEMNSKFISDFYNQNECVELLKSSKNCKHKINHGHNSGLGKKKKKKSKKDKFINENNTEINNEQKDDNKGSSMSSFNLNYQNDSEKLCKTHKNRRDNSEMADSLNSITGNEVSCIKKDGDTEMLDSNLRKKKKKKNRLTIKNNNKSEEINDKKDEDDDEEKTNNENSQIIKTEIGNSNKRKCKHYLIDSDENNSPKKKRIKTEAVSNTEFCKKENRKLKDVSVDVTQMSSIHPDNKSEKENTEHDPRRKADETKLKTEPISHDYISSDISSNEGYTNKKHIIKRKSLQQNQSEDENGSNQEVYRNKENNITTYSTMFKKKSNGNDNLKQVLDKNQRNSIITNDDEIWLLKWPQRIDVNTLKRNEITLDGKCKVKINNNTYYGNIDNNVHRVTIMSLQQDNYVIKNLILNGIVNFRKRVPKF